MIQIIKLLYSLSIFIFLAVLLYVYAFLPYQVGVYFDDQGTVVVSLAKANFFYVALGLFVLTNGLIGFYRRMNRENLNISKADFEDMSNFEIVYHWLNGLSFVLNVMYIFSILFIGMFHNSEHFDITNYVTLIFIGPVLLVGWVFWLIYLQFSIR